MLPVLLVSLLVADPAYEVREPIPVAVAPAQTRSASASALPDTFEVNEKFWSWTTSLNIEANGRSYGKVTEKFLSWTKSFVYEDASGACVAKARKRAMSWGVEIEVDDCSGTRLGTIEENVFESFLGVGIWNSYTIKNARGVELAKSEKVQLLATNITLSDASGQVARLHRPVNITVDSWAVAVSRPGVVDKRVLVFIAAYKTSKDND